MPSSGRAVFRSLAACFLASLPPAVQASRLIIDKVQAEGNKGPIYKALKRAAFEVPGDDEDDSAPSITLHYADDAAAPPAMKMTADAGAQRFHYDPHTSARLSLESGLPIGMWALSFNQGKLGKEALDALTNNIVEEAVVAKVHLIVIGVQEVSQFWLPTLPADWTVYRTRIQLMGTFSLQTLVLTRGLEIRTRRLTPSQLPTGTWQVPADDGAPGCRSGQPEGLGCWGIVVPHECGGRDAVAISMCTKATLVTVLEITPIPPSQLPANLTTPWSKWEWREPATKTWLAPPLWSARLVVANSHLGMVKSPLAEQMVARSKQVSELTNLVRAATGNFVAPSVMLGDWNFRMSPFGTLRRLILEHGGKIEANAHYSGPVISRDADGTWVLSKVKGQPFQPDAFYDEIYVANAMIRSNLQSVPKGLRVWEELRRAHVMSNTSLQLTCRFSESRGMESHPVDWVDPPEVKGDGTGMLTYSGGEWRLFEQAGHDLKPKGDKGDDELLVTRVPSACDRVFWSAGNKMKEALVPARGGLSIYTPSKLEAQAALLRTDHLPVIARLKLAFQDRENAESLRAQLAPTNTKGMLCCCVLEDPVETSQLPETVTIVMANATGELRMVEDSKAQAKVPTRASRIRADSCKWKEEKHVRIGSGCNRLGAVEGGYGRHHVYGQVLRESAEKNLISTASDPQRACESLHGEIYALPTGKYGRMQKFAFAEGAIRPGDARGSIFQSDQQSDPGASDDEALSARFLDM